MHNEFLDKFLYMSKSNLKFSISLLGSMMWNLITKSKSEWRTNYKDMDDKLIMSKITTYWIQIFMNKYNIFVWSQTRKLQCSP